ncbi:putative glycosyltransferase, exosortase G system-associated [bacterium]|nr:putative glycosyltransferase, exosortase G system-associated [bacterium]MCB2179346.1 putative glycosyltransferase, exosortase G system-associated [bacterium]
MSTLQAYAFFWGIWLLVPILVDGISVLFSILGTVMQRRKEKQTQTKLSFYPKVTIIIPVLNGERTLRACVNSITRQHYPLDQMEVLIIDNGSTDQSFNVFQSINTQGLRVTWHRITGRGKAWALNSGIYLSQGQYIINIDCDMTLDPDAVRNAIEYLENNLDVGAATGYLVIQDPDKQATTEEKLLASCEFLEYTTVFGVGRSYQSFLDSLNTISGAFSIFRRDALMKTLLYNKDTVSEDTDLTYQLYMRAPQYRIVSLANSIAYLFPIESWSRLYSQRVRWQRGQLEVNAVHYDSLDKKMLKVKGLSPTRSLLIDHTLALPRLIWLAFMPVLSAFGYSSRLIFSAYMVMYAFYLLVEVLWVATAWVYTEPKIRRRVEKHLYALPFLPVYRIIVFLFRVAGFINVMKEPFQWHIPNPLEQTRAGLEDIRQKLTGLFKTS